jgi:hypothetical protein
VGVFVGLTIVESVLFGGLIALFLPNPYKLILIGLIVALFLFVLVKIFSELWTHHSLTETDLKLRYGLDLATTIPRTAIAEAIPFSETARNAKKRTIMDMGVRYEADDDRLVATFSKKGQVLLILNDKQSFRFGLTRKVQTNKLLINVDAREEFLAALMKPDVQKKSSDLVKES